jgi:hypothetical protein
LASSSATWDTVFIVLSQSNTRPRSLPVTSSGAAAAEAPSDLGDVPFLRWVGGSRVRTLRVGSRAELRRVDTAAGP